VLIPALLLTTALLQAAPLDTANADLRATAAERRSTSSHCSTREYRRITPQSARATHHHAESPKR